MVVLAFVLFHIADPGAALREVYRVLRTSGSIGVTAWGRDGVARAAQIWDEELDRYGAARESPVVARHELMNTPQKLQALLEGAGFVRLRALVAPAEPGGVRRAALGNRRCGPAFRGTRAAQACGLSPSGAVAAREALASRLR